MTLTDSQRARWHRIHPDGVVPTGEQTQEQAEEAAIGQFLYVLGLDDPDPPPAEAEVRELIAEG